MYYQLTKPDKKIAKACIDKGVDAEFREGLETSENILRDWRAGKFAGNKEAYHELFQAVHKKDKAISRRYDGLGGSRWLQAVAEIFGDGYIAKEDIAGFSDGARIAIEQWTRGLDDR